jgi:hypothetical protein
MERERGATPPPGTGRPRLSASPADPAAGPRAGQLEAAPSLLRVGVGDFKFHVNMNLPVEVQAPSQAGTPPGPVTGPGPGHASSPSHWQARF